MKKMLTIMLSGAALCIMTPMALADTNQTAAQTMPVSDAPQIATVIQKLASVGYQNFHEVEWQKGVYEVKANDKEGKGVELTVDGKTYAVTKTEPKKKPFKVSKDLFSMSEAIQKIEVAGYHEVSDIKLEKKKYEVEALDKDNQKVKLKINAHSGRIHQE